MKQILCFVFGLLTLVTSAQAASFDWNKISSKVVADAGSAVVPSASLKQKYDAAYSVCKAVVPTSHRDFTLANGVGPSSVLLSYFMSLGQEVDIKGWQVTVADGPKHGVLVPYPDEAVSFVYRPNEGYLGLDQITYIVEAQGKKFKVIETVWVENAAPDFGCPTDIKLPPATTGNDKRSAH